jgi:hypothetical protein
MVHSSWCTGSVPLLYFIDLIPSQIINMEMPFFMFWAYFHYIYQSFSYQGLPGLAFRVFLDATATLGLRVLAGLSNVLVYSLCRLKLF